MTSFDDRLAQGLSADDEAFLKDLENGDGIFTQLGATFSGPLKAVTAFGFILTFVMFGAAIWALYQVSQAETVKDMFLWFGLFIFGSLGVAMLKMWFWLRMNHLVVLKELKRIEFRLVQQGKGA